MLKAGARALVVLTILLVGAIPSAAQRQSKGGPVFPFAKSGPNYSVCIGTGCRFPCYTSVQAAAASVCQDRKGGTPVYPAPSISSGGQCGRIYLQISCPAQVRYNVCIGTYQSACNTVGLYAGPIDYYYDCWFLYSWADAPGVAAQNICAAKGWIYGTAAVAHITPAIYVDTLM
jgi:hypothetical protein